MGHVINWFEIPSTDLERAAKFYGDVLGRPFEIALGPGDGRMAAFAPPDAEVNGVIVQTDLYTPGPNGPALYLTVEGDLDVYLARVEPAGGRVINPKTSLQGESGGHWARFEDTESNIVGLYSRT